MKRRMHRRPLPGGRPRRGDHRGDVRGDEEGDRQQHHRLAAGRRTVRLAGCGRGREQAVPGRSPGRRTSTSSTRQWDTHLQKFDATLAGGNGPDVIEMGNTEMTKYMAAGAFADITADKSKFPNSSTWLKGLKDSATYNGKLFGVPYYAGSRVVIYRTDHFKKVGITKAPTSLSQFVADGKKLQAKYGAKDKTFSAFYVAGPDWYSALAYVYDYGGQIATTSKGKWVGTLDLAAGDPGPDGVQEHVRRALAREQGRRTRRTRSRPRRSRRAMRRRSSARAGSSATRSTRRPATRS